MSDRKVTTERKQRRWMFCITVLICTVVIVPVTIIFFAPLVESVETNSALDPGSRMTAFFLLSATLAALCTSIGLASVDIALFIVRKLFK